MHTYSINIYICYVLVIMKHIFIATYILTNTNKSFKNIILKNMTYNLQKWLFKINVYISTKMVDVSLYPDSIIIGTHFSK